MALSAGGTGPPRARHVVCHDDRSDGPGAAERHSGVAQSDRRYAPYAAGRTRHADAVERVGMGADASRLAVSDEHAGDTRATRAAHQSVAGHARTAPDDADIAGAAAGL